MPKYQIALDIGATKILGASMCGKKIITKIKKPTQSKAGKIKTLANINKVIENLLIPNTKLIKIGIGIAGQVDNKTGIILSTGNFDKSFQNVKLAESLKKKYKCSVNIDNDVKCFLAAEMKYGVGRSFKNVIGLTFGTGIGGAIMENGELKRGMNNTAGEFGHMKISGHWLGSPPMCGCGEKYCWESMASGKAWQKLAKKYNKNKANEIIIYNIVTGLLNICYAFNPEVIILGGGLMEHPDMLPKIKKEFNSRCQFPWFKKVKLLKPSLKDEAILLGSLL